MGQTKLLYVFRHGETDWNREGRLQGGVDTELNATGRLQAQKLKTFFETNPVEVVLSSDLSRALETARIATSSLGIPIVREPLLRETNLGAVEGLTRAEVELKFGVESWHSWASSDPDHGYFRFAGGESKREHLDRLLNGLVRFVQSTHFNRIAVSTHGGAMRRLIHHFRPDLTTPVLVSNCSVFELTCMLTGELCEWTIDIEPKA